MRVVGWYVKSPSDFLHPFLWEKDLVSGVERMIDLDNHSSRNAFPWGVNAPGEVTGDISVAGVYQAFFWNNLGIKQQRPTLGGARSSAASINDAGFVTGFSQRSGKNASAHAFIWGILTGIRDLNLLKAPGDTSGIELTAGVKINNAGQILARGLRKSVAFDVLLQP